MEKPAKQQDTAPKPYCSYISGHCVHQPDSPPCKKRNPVECRSHRQRIEREAAQ